MLAKATEAQGVLVTAGEGGCSYAFHSSKGSKEVYKGFIPILTVDVAETTGAGDAFLAGFLFGLVNVRLLPLSPRGYLESPMPGCLFGLTPFLDSEYYFLKPNDRP